MFALHYTTDYSLLFLWPNCTVYLHSMLLSLNTTLTITNGPFLSRTVRITLQLQLNTDNWNKKGMEFYSPVYFIAFEYSGFHPNDLQLQFTADLAVAAMAPNVTLLILNGLLGHRFKIFPRYYSSARYTTTNTKRQKV